MTLSDQSHSSQGAEEIVVCSSMLSEVAFLLLPALYVVQCLCNSRVSVCLSHRLKAAVGCGWFAAVCSVLQSGDILMDSYGHQHSIPAVDQYLLHMPALSSKCW